MHRTLGEHLVENGILDKQSLKIALSEQAVTKEQLGEILIRFGFLRREVVTDVLMKLNPDVSIDTKTGDIKLAKSFFLETKTMIRGDVGDTIFVATLHNDIKYVAESIEKSTGKSVKLVPTSHNEILDYLARIQREEKSYRCHLAEEEDINKVVNAIIIGALNNNATDIHIEYTEKSIHVRYRIDGLLDDESQVLSLSQAGKLFSIIKERAGLDVTEYKEPQDGSFSFEYRGRNIDFRVSTLPTTSGDKSEKITMRILDKERVLMDIRTLGITEIDRWTKLAEQQNGLVLVCGSTGSGKTTTLYSTIMHLDKIHRSVYTIEDPVEYKLPFIQQSQVNWRTGFGFAGFTRTILRHDPDVVVVGEIRDNETAENTMHLADTGHLVYATLHTNDIVSTLTRLEKIGVNMQHLSFLLRGILVQKLVRKLCVSCHGKGCSYCRNTGYFGRTLLTEFVSIDDPGDLNLILDRKKEYMKFTDDARLKVLQGVTDCREIMRITEVNEKFCADNTECIKGDIRCIQ